MAKKKPVSAVDALRQLLASGNYHTKVQIAQHLANCGFATDPSRVMTALRRAGGVVVPGTRRKPAWYNGQPPANEAAADLRRTRSIMISYPHNRQGLVDYVLQNWKKLSRKAHAQVMTWLGKECKFQKIALPFLRKLEKRLGL